MTQGYRLVMRNIKVKQGRIKCKPALPILFDGQGRLTIMSVVQVQQSRSRATETWE